jgi:hypothetical protein
MDDARMPSSSVRVVASSLALLTSWSSLALAAPGVLKNDADARSAPFGVAPLVEVVPAHAKVTADDRPNNGWWRVQLPDGKFAYVRAEDIDVDLTQVKAPPPPPAPFPGAAETTAPAAAAPVEPLATPQPVGARAPTYVGDFSHLARLVKADPRVFERASTLDARQTAGAATAVAGVLAAALMIVLADNLLQSETCVRNLCVDHTNVTLHNAGLGLLFVAPVLGWAIYPTAADRAEVMSEWNQRHPDRPFVDHAGVEAPQ